MIWKCIARKRTVPHTGNYYFLAGDDQQLNNSPSSFRFPRALNMLSGLVTSVRVCEVCQYHICASMQVCEVCEFRLVTSVHQINARSPFPPSTLTDIIVLRSISKSRIYLKNHIVKMCKRKTKSHQSSSCEFILEAIETNWLTKLLLHVVSCHRRALSVIKLRLFNTKNISTLSRYWIRFKYLWIPLNCMWVQKVLAIETNWATKCRVIRAHYQWLTLTND